MISMRVRGCVIVKLLITILILLQLSYGKLLGYIIPFFAYSSLNSIWAVTYVLIIIFIIIMCGYLIKFVDDRYLVILIGMILLSIVEGAIHSNFLNQKKITISIIYGTQYFYSLLSMPILTLLVKDKWNFRNFLKTIAWFTSGAYFFRAILSKLWELTGVRYFDWIIREYAIEQNYRNGVLRLNPPCLSLLLIPILVYLIKTSNRQLEAIKYSLLVIWDLFYTLCIHQARSVSLYHIIILAFIWLIGKTTNTKKMIAYIIAIVGLIIIYNLDFTQSFIASFSLNAADTGASTALRIRAVLYFGNRYLETPIWGLGFLSAQESTLASGYGGLGDIGFLGSIFKLGLPIVIVYFMLFIRGIYVAHKIKDIDRNKYVLVMSMTVLMLITGINIDCFYGIYSFAVPFYIAIVEYILFKNDSDNEMMIYG